MIKEIDNDIFKELKSGDLLIHQVNCMGKMGTGLALQIKQNFYEAFEEYKKICDSRSYEEKKKLIGKVLGVNIDTGFGIIKVCNLFGQFRYGRETRHTDYDAVRKGLRTIAIKYKENNCTGRILIPYHMGCGNAGGDWNIIRKIIEEELYNLPVIICKFK